MVEESEHSQRIAQVSEGGSYICPVVSALACAQFDELVDICANIGLRTMSPSRLVREKLRCGKDPELTGTCDASALQHFHLAIAAELDGLKLVNDAVRKGGGRPV
jgi:hypothetical protein